MEAGLDREAEHRTVEPRADHVADHRVRWALRVDIERQVEIGTGAQDRVELFFV
jgi:hypothetical protein